MTTESREQFIGAATLILLAVVMVFLNQSRDVRGGAEAAIEAVALFGRIDGLAPGAEVRMGGVRIGTVRSQKLDEKYRALVTLALDPDVAVPKDSSASIQTDGIFGGKFVVLEPGAEEAPIQTGDMITRTQDAQVVSDVLDQIISEGRAKIAQRKASGGAK